MDPIVAFVHNDVLIDGFTPALGNIISSSSASAGHTYTTTLPMSLPGSVDNPNNLKVVAMVANSDDTVMNVREAHFGENQNFEVVN